MRVLLLISHQPLMQWRMAAPPCSHPPTSLEGQLMERNSHHPQFRWSGEKLQGNIALGTNSWRVKVKVKQTLNLFNLLRLLGGSANNASLVHSFSCYCLPPINQVTDSIHAPCLGSTIILTIYWLNKAWHTVALWRIYG